MPQLLMARPILGPRNLRKILNTMLDLAYLYVVFKILRVAFISTLPLIFD